MYHFINNDFAREYFVLRFHSNYLANEKTCLFYLKRTCFMILPVLNISELAAWNL